MESVPFKDKINTIGHQCIMCVALRGEINLRIVSVPFKDKSSTIRKFTSIGCFRRLEPPSDDRYNAENKRRQRICVCKDALIEQQELTPLGQKGHLTSYKCMSFSAIPFRFSKMKRNKENSIKFDEVNSLQSKIRRFYKKKNFFFEKDRKIFF